MNFEKVIRPERVIQFGEGGFLRGFVASKDQRELRF